MMKLAHVAAAFCVLAAVVSVASAASQSPGKIAFVRSSTGPERIWVVSPDGRHQRVVTPRTMSAETPELARDGKRIAFSRLVATPGTVQHDIYIVGATGSGLRRLTSSRADEAAPTWSPDARRIAYQVVSGKQSDIWVMNADGRGRHRLTRTAQSESVPSWSGNGRRIAYARDGRIWVMNADGTGQRVLTRMSSGVDWAPAWSPDGARIAYESNRQTTGREPTNEIWLMAADGSHQVRLTHNSVNDSQPAWSPDGRWLVFASQIPHPGHNHIWLVRPSGKGLHPITATGDEYHPTWSR